MIYSIKGVWPEYRTQGQYKDSEERVATVDDLERCRDGVFIPPEFEGVSREEAVRRILNAVPTLKDFRAARFDLRMASLILNDDRVSGVMTEFFTRYPFSWAAFTNAEVVEFLEEGCSPEDAVIRYVAEGFPVEGENRPDFDCLTRMKTSWVNREMIASWGSVPGDRALDERSRETTALAFVFLGLNQLPRIVGHHSLIASWDKPYEDLLAACVEGEFDRDTVLRALTNANEDRLDCGDAYDCLDEFRQHIGRRSESAILKALALFRRREFVSQSENVELWLASFRGYAAGLLHGKSLPEILVWGDGWTEVYQ